MEIVKVTAQHADAFIQYCKSHRDSLDDSYLGDDELKALKLEKDDPSYIALDRDEVIGAVSLRMDDYLLRGKKARFRILHSKDNSSIVYDQLFNAIKTEMASIETAVLFIPEGMASVRDQLIRLGFQVARFSYLLTRKLQQVPAVQLTEGYSVKIFELGKDEEAYCHIRNTAFSTLAGSETPITPEETAKLAVRKDSVPNGIRFILHHGRAIGLVRVAKDLYNGIPYAVIGPLALLPDYQKKGLGRQLLRAGLTAGLESGFDHAILSVNAENELAVRLYTSEGFTTEESFVCYHYKP
ncbi:hypothetical protein A8F94_02715 [Bacillus sp. FJAT-27225]|uniref:GNAT family N-acetyltransferase n=1 Tax=Bacillus sp. FJAT-27225 TaxID=1743144 RepID=UPI00080C3023|nr:GNAT family N-acetyltransferase [Bacillus sp. FJAT-27225]OCA90804.1 hypothetical protein A8F94_02715 [Bacillus sp. FJAT-27225]